MDVKLKLMKKFKCIDEVILIAYIPIKLYASAKILISETPHTCLY